MTTAFRKSFTQDLKKIRNQSLLKRVQQVIKRVEAADAFNDVSNLKKLSGAENCYRIRVGDYRIGIYVEADTVEFVRCLHRRELYRYFP
jgi:mRNA interferase RelE/StbE